ncbi:hypothetical protein [Micromonospora fluostatini]|uniref:hypothetical protein n=1 Tax=Micromonospora sp. JCM 30529 TaxID=3421643 RepID=UPI003D1796FD
MRRVVGLLGLPLVLVVGCGPAGTEGAGHGGPPDAASVGTPQSGPGGGTEGRRAAFEQRAAQVADAWRPGPTWTSGYVPLQEPTVLVGDPAFTPQTEQAYRSGWYRVRVDLPTARPPDGVIRFPAGTRSVPLVSAADAYRHLDQGDPPSCPPEPGGGVPEPRKGGPVVPPGPDDPVQSQAPRACVSLTVTEVALGTAPVRTSRGVAQVPAWLFTVAELDARVARLAVAPEAVDAVPDATPPSSPAPEGLVGAVGLDAVAGDRIDLRLGLGACDTDITPLVWERDDLVVLGGGVVRSTDVCTEQLHLEPVSVTLRAPLGNRTVLDALTGAPVRLHTP